MSIQDDLSALIAAGHRPMIRSHAISWPTPLRDGSNPELEERLAAGWQPFYMPAFWDGDDVIKQLVGWSVRTIGQGFQDIEGGTFGTLEAAIADVMRQMRTEP